MPPRYESWADYQARIEFMVEAGAVEDYTYFWWDVRPHPNLGTVEIRVCDAQTRLEHTVALAALIQAMCKELAEHYEAGYELGTLPAGDARGEQVARRPLRHRGRADRPAAEQRVSAPPSWRGASSSGCARTREELGCERELEGIEDMVERGTGAQRQLAVWRGEPRPARARCARSSRRRRSASAGACAGRERGRG